MKDLPKMYHSTIDKKINNLQNTYSTMDNRYTSTDIKEHPIYDRYAIEQKIKNIFNSPDYIYKADVFIELDNEVVKKRIIAKINNYLVTSDNEHIPIDKIKDIYK